MNITSCTSSQAKVEPQLYEEACRRGADICISNGTNEDVAKLTLNLKETFAELGTSQIVYGEIYPALLVATIIANILVMVVLTQKHMQTPTNMLLLYMAIADLFVALVPFPFMCFMFILRHYEQNMIDLETWHCYLYNFLVDAFPPFFHNVAMWLTVLLAAQRLIYIKFPLSANSYCTTANVNIATSCIILASFICSLPKFIDYEPFSTLKWQIFNETFSGQLIYECYICQTMHQPYVLSIGVNLYYGIYFWLRVILFITIPSCLLIIFSYFLILSLREAQRRRNRLLEERRQSVCGQQREQNTTFMLVLIVVLFLFVNLPQGIMLALFCIQNAIDPIQPFMDPKSLRLAFMVDNMLILATYPINFAIYCSMSAQFRQTFKALFLHSDRLPNFNRRRSSRAPAEGANRRNGSTRLVNEANVPLLQSNPVVTTPTVIPTTVLSTSSTTNGSAYSPGNINEEAPETFL